MMGVNTVELVMWLAEESGDAFKLVSGPRHEDGVPLLVYWLPKKLVWDLVRIPNSESRIQNPECDTFPKVIFTVPGWLVAQHNLGKFKAGG